MSLISLIIWCTFGGIYGRLFGNFNDLVLNIILVKIREESPTGLPFFTPHREKEPPPIPAPPPG